MSDKKECPICDCNEIGQGKHMAQGNLFPLHKVFTSGSEVITEICTNCGHILSMRAVTPHIFK
jgi:predicted nucleic-acid-binding Zn-ribbon protein